MDLVAKNIIKHFEHPTNIIHQVFELTTTKNNQLKVSRFSDRRQAIIYMIDSALKKCAYIIDLLEPTSDNMMEYIVMLIHYS